MLRAGYKDGGEAFDLRGAIDSSGCIQTGGPSLCFGPGSIQAINPALVTNVGAVIAETLAGQGNFVSKLTLTADELLEAGVRFLGMGYAEIGKAESGVFRSGDGLRQFRIDSNSLAGRHVNRSGFRGGWLV